MAAQSDMTIKVDPIPQASAMGPRAQIENYLGCRPHMIEMGVLKQAYAKRDPLYDVVDGVALISVTGVLGNDPWFADTTYARIQSEVAKAVADPAVKGILLVIDSPGGQTDGAFETAEKIEAVRGKKPICAVADTMAYSAAYLIACSTDMIYVSPITGGVGSAGVYSMHVDYSQYMKEMGVAVTFISAGKGKTDGNAYEPLSESAKATIQKEVDRLYDAFTTAIARNRKMSVEQVKKLGAVLFEGSQNAIGSGLADRAGDLETAWVEFATSLSQAQQTSMAAASAEAVGKPSEVINMEGQTNSADTNKTAAPAANQAASTAAVVPPVTPAAPSAASAEELIELCATAGKPASVAVEMLSKKMTLKDATKMLLTGMASEAGAETRSTTLPNDGISASSNSNNKPAPELMKAIETMFPASR